MLPAGEMWSVVMESPSTASTRAPRMEASGFDLLGHALEIGRVLHVGGAGVPAVGVALGGDVDRLPLLRPLEHVAVALLEHLARDDAVDGVRHLLLGRPDVLQVDRLAVLAGADRLLRQVLGDACRRARRRPPAAARPGSWRAHWRGRGPRSCGCPRAPRPRPACCPRSRRRSGRAAGRSCRCRWCSRSRPSGSRARPGPSCRPGLVQVLGHHLAAGRERGLHPGLGREALCHAPSAPPARPRPARRGSRCWCRR